MVKFVVPMREKKKNFASSKKLLTSIKDKERF